jgi:colicin import membrane protein
VAFGDNKYIDIPAITGIIDKMHSLLEGAYEKEEAAAAAVKAEADRVAKEAAEKKEQADREKAEAAAALEKANQELLHDAGFTFDGKAYTKGGFLINADKAKCSPSSDVGAFIVATDKKIAANEVAAKKAEEDRLAAEKAAAERAAAEKEAARKSYALKVEEMTAAINNCEDHEEVVKAILADEIPHVRFVAE